MCCVCVCAQGRPSSVSSQSSQQSMRSSSSKHVSSSSATPSSSYPLLQPLVPEVKEMSSGYTRLSANPMVGERPPHCLPASRPPPSLPPCLLTPAERARCVGAARVHQGHLVDTLLSSHVSGLSLLLSFADGNMSI